MKIIDKATWKRKEHFDFFSSFDEPFFGLVTEIDCSIAYKKCKNENISFFAYYLHKALLAINQVEEFSYRMVGDDIVVYDEIHASATLGRIDETFAFSFIEFEEDFKGSIEVGKAADFTIFSKDIMTVDEMEILNAEVMMTVINGKVVYKNEANN